MPNQIPTLQDNPGGLHQRYIVTKANGEPVDPDAVYFVLRIDRGGRHAKHTACCRHAARAYCEAAFNCNDNGLLHISEDLYELLNEIDDSLPPEPPE